MTSDREQFDRLFDAYLDDQLDAASRARFEELLRNNPEFRQEIEAQARIDRSLERIFTSPSFSEPLPIDTSMAPSANPRSPRSRWRSYSLATAAGIVIVVGVSLWYWNFSGKLNEPPIAQKQTFNEYYEEVKARNFEPDWECKDEKEFAATFYVRLGTALALANAPPGVDPLGLCYTNTVTPRTMAMTFKVDDQGVVVFVDRLKSDNIDPIKQFGGLHLFKRPLEHLMLYEVTPFDQPRVLEMWKERDIPQEWKQLGYRSPPTRKD